MSEFDSLMDQYKGLGGSLGHTGGTRKFVKDIYRLLARRSDGRVKRDKVMYHASFIAASWDQTIIKDRELSKK